jgi:DNA-binding CsgD family transcriptional regulator
VERYLDIHGLTKTERKIARLALKGLSNREIANVNGNTEKTVKFHMTIIYDKCQVGSRSEFFNSILPT